MAKSRSSDSRRTPAPSPSVATGESGPAAPRKSRRDAVAETTPARSSTSASRQGSAPRAPSASRPPIAVPVETRRAMIAEAAYLRAERRGFGAGHEEEDWLAAEKEVDALLSAGQGGPQ
jgi:hypothetical protein